MSSHTISGYAAGYVLGAGDYLTITCAGTVAVTGLTAGFGSTVVNEGSIFSGPAAAGADGAGYSAYYQGARVGYSGHYGVTGGYGAGVHLTMLTNDGVISGGQGGAGERRGVP